MDDFYKDKENKAGWNASEEIIKTISYLRNTFITAKLFDDFPRQLESIRCILDVISGKVGKEDIKTLNIKIYLIEQYLPKAEIQYNYNGIIKHTYPVIRNQVKRMMESLYRDLEKLQDECGYGMISSEDPRFAVMQR